MVACPTCHAESDDEARFCHNCGAKLQQPGHLSDFEIGKIAALDSIKKDILKWVGGTATVIGVTFAALAYFGLNETLKSSVNEQVKVELKQNRNDIDKAIKDLYIAVGKADKDQEKITKTLIDSLATLSNVNEATSQIQKNIAVASDQLGMLKDATIKTDAERRKLEEIIENLNIASLMSKLRYDFYHVREFSGSLDLLVNQTENKIRNFTTYIDLLRVKVRKDNQNTTNANEQIAEMGNNAMGTNVITALRDNNGKIIEFRGRYYLFQPFDDRVYNHDISAFEHIDRVEMRMVIPVNDGASVDQLKSSIGTMHVVVSVNWMPLWQFDMDNKDITETEKQDENWIIRLTKQNPTDETTITKKYEALFAEQGGLSTNSK